MAKIAVYPGSFDPVTTGHVDIIRRASNIFEQVNVAVSHNPNKDPLFTMEERIEMLEKAVEDFENVEIEGFTGLLTDYVEAHRGEVIIRGLRAVSDFEYEFQMALTNKKLAPEIETLFMMTNTEYAYLSSSTVKEVASFNGCIEDLVPAHVIGRLMKKLEEEGRLITKED